MSDQAVAVDKIETQSSIFAKTDPDLRRRLDQAVIDHDPPTYQALFDKFDLAAKGISFMAFYRYARRIRTHAAMIELTHRALPDDCDPIAVLPQLLADRLLDAAIDESTSARTLHSLTDAWRFAARTQLVLERHRTEIEKLKKQTNNPESNELTNIVKQMALHILTKQAAQLEDQQETADTTPDPDHINENATHPNTADTEPAPTTNHHATDPPAPDSAEG